MRTKARAHTISERPDYRLCPDKCTGALMLMRQRESTAPERWTGTLSLMPAVPAGAMQSCGTVFTRELDKRST